MGPRATTVAALVALAAPLSGRLADARGERLPALLGFAAAGVALAILGTGVVPLDGAPALPFLGLVGLGLGLLFAPTSRAALNAVSPSHHGRVSSVLSLGRLLGAGAGAALAGAALGSGVSTANVQGALVGGAALCLALGLPAALALGPGRRPAGARRRPAPAR
jgi:MFS family permease